MSLAVLSLTIGGLLIAVWTGQRRQQRDLVALVERLARADASAHPPSSGDELDSLPEPVARYLRWSGATSQRPGLVRLRQTGTLRLAVTSTRWMSFNAEHLASPGAPGFVWNARVAVAPLVHVRVRDAFVEGEGSGHVALLSAATVGTEAGTPEMNSGSLHRFLAEAVWYPSALLPGPMLRWSALDAGRALATLTVQGVSVVLEFRFAETGEVTGIFTPTRWGRFDGRHEQWPWEGHFRNYRQRDGLQVPFEGEVGWYDDGEWHVVWKGTIVEFESGAAFPTSGS
jgi:hypothetical protein